MTIIVFGKASRGCIGIGIHCRHHKTCVSPASHDSGDMVSCRHSLDDTSPQQPAVTAKLFRTQSAPLRHHSSHKLVPASPSRHELHEFEQLLMGTNVHMPTHLQLLGATSR